MLLHCQERHAVSMYHGLLGVGQGVVVTCKAVCIDLNLGAVIDDIILDSQCNRRGLAVNYRKIQVISVVGAEDIQGGGVSGTGNDLSTSMPGQQSEHLPRALQLANVAPHRDHTLVDGHEEFSAVNVIGLLAFGKEMELQGVGKEQSV